MMWLWLSSLRDPSPAVVAAAVVAAVIVGAVSFVLVVTSPLRGPEWHRIDILGRLDACQHLAKLGEPVDCEPLQQRRRELDIEVLKRRMAGD